MVSSLQIFQQKFSMHLLHLTCKPFVPSVLPFMQNYTFIKDITCSGTEKIQNTDTSDEFILVLYANIFVSDRATKLCVSIVF
jgi:hypothetical protein